MYLLASFILQNFKKTLTIDPELRGCAAFWPKIAHLPWTNFFQYKPLLLFREWGVKNFRKIFAGESEMFILVWGDMLLRGGVILLDASRNFEVKIKTA